MKNVEQLFKEDGVRVIIGRVFATNDPVIRCNAIKMLMSSGGLTSYIRSIVWEYCTDLLKEIDIDR